MEIEIEAEQTMKKMGNVLISPLHTTTHREHLFLLARWWVDYRYRTLTCHPIKAAAIFLLQIHTYYPSKLATMYQLLNVVSLVCTSPKWFIDFAIFLVLTHSVARSPLVQALFLATFRILTGFGNAGIWVFCLIFSQNPWVFKKKCFEFLGKIFKFNGKI